jgi:hypothetical protein
MIVFSLICLSFFPLIFGAELVEDKLIQLYKETNKIYLRIPAAPYLDSQLKESHLKIRDMLEDYLREKKNPKELFNILYQDANLQTAHFFFREIFVIISRFRHIYCILNDWRDHLDTSPKAVISFFKLADDLMVKVFAYDSEVAKEILPIILSIQWQHIYLVKDQEERKRITERIRKFEFSSHTLEQKWTLRGISKLFKKLRLMANRHKGEIPMDGEDRSLILKSLDRFKNFCFQFYNNLWEELDNYKFTALSRELVYHIVIDRSRARVFDLLRNPQKLIIIDFRLFNDDFLVIRKAYLNTVNTNEISLEHPHFIKFLCDIVKTDEIPENLSQKHLWLIKCFLYILPIFKRDKVEIKPNLFTPIFPNLLSSFNDDLD